MKTKPEQRSAAVDYCVRIGVEKYFSVDGEDEFRNNTYYQIHLSNGETGYLKNLTDEQISRLNMACGRKIKVEE